MQHLARRQPLPTKQDSNAFLAEASAKQQHSCGASSVLEAEGIKHKSLSFKKLFSVWTGDKFCLRPSAGIFLRMVEVDKASLEERTCP